MPDIGGLQLLPETRKKIEVRVPGQNRPLVFSAVFALLILGLYFGLMFYKNSVLSSISQIDEQLTTLENSRDKKLEQKLLDLSQQLGVINPLLNSHVFWSQALTKIQNLTQPQVQIQTLGADGLSKKLTIKAVAANYTTIAKQIAAFYTDESITDIILNKAQGLKIGRASCRERV